MGKEKKQNGLGTRMKSYEWVNRTYLPRRLPVIIRVDGCHFHSFTNGMKKPFDEELAKALWETAKFLAKTIQGSKLAYHQSDEISLLLTNYDKLTTASWFDNNLQKMASVSASTATAIFNSVIHESYPDKPLATFDSRVFVVPHDEVANYFIWRQQDATKNSISMVAQSQFSHNELQGWNGEKMQEELFVQKGINWNNLPVWQKRGLCITRQTFLKNGAERHRWDIDEETPIFTKDRDYIERFVYLN